MMPGPIGSVGASGGAPWFRRRMLAGIGRVDSEPTNVLSSVTPSTSRMSWKRVNTNMSYFST